MKWGQEGDLWEEMTVLKCLEEKEPVREGKKKKVFYSFSQKYWICSNKHNHFWYKPEGATFSYQMMRDVVVNKYSSFQLPEQLHVTSGQFWNILDLAIL